MADLAVRFNENPILKPGDIRPSKAGLKVECLLNPGVFRFRDKTWLLIRVAERPEQKQGMVSFPVLDAGGDIRIMEFPANDPDIVTSDPRVIQYKGQGYLTTMSHLRLMHASDYLNFSEPPGNSIIFGQGALESFGIEDCRVSVIGHTYYLTYTQVSEHGVGVGMMSTTDWKHMNRHGMIIAPHNKDCALFEEPINSKYYCLHRPSGVDLGGNYIWLAESDDLEHWGNHKCIVQTRKGMWDSARVGAGASPIKTEKGWLEIYHGADHNNRYCLGALLLDLNDPSKVLARSHDPVMEPAMPYEKTGFFGNVVFTNGHLVNGDEIVLYYGASDEVICGARLSVSGLLKHLGV